MSGIEVAGVFSDPVHPRHEAYVLDGTGLQEGVPGIDALLGPAGHIQDQVVIRLAVDQPVPRKDGETEVVAHLQENPETGILHDHPFIPGLVVVVFTRIGEKMMLVIILIMSVRENEIKPVAEPFPGQD